MSYGTNRNLVGILLLTLACPVLAQAPQPAPPPKDLTVEWIYSDEGEEPGKVPRYAWTSANDVLLLDTRKPKAQRTLERVAAATGARKPAVDLAVATRSLEALVGPEALPDGLPWPESLDRAGKTALYVLAGDVFALDLASSRFARLTATPEAESHARLSPDGRRAAFVRANDLYTVDVATRAETRLTRDGSSTVLNGLLTWLYWEEVFDHDDDAYWWSDDSAAIAFLRFDESPVPVSTFTGFAGARPQVITQRYPKAGEPNPIAQLGIVEAATGKTVWMSASEAPYEYILRATWLPDGRSLAVQVTNRTQTRLDLYRFDRATGTATPILHDPDDAWVNIKELQPANGGKELILSSDRDGYTHLYRYTLDGKLVNAVTKGAWSVHGTHGFYSAPLLSAVVDDARGLVYFTSLQKSSLERHLYRVRLDGTGMERLTKEDGVHEVTFSPDRRYYVDEHSSHAALPSLSVHDADGVLKAALAPARPELLAPFRLTTPELLTISAADGFPLPARLTKPRDFDPAKKYPVILNVYGGPGSPMVQDTFRGGNAYFDQILARSGYVVASVDNRTATGISKAMERSVVNKVWSDKELDDFLDAIRWLKAQPWVDASRVGVWGWSGGGSSTLLLMTRSKELKAGIAVAPNTEWRYYDTKFSETYMKTPADNPDGYAHASLVARAKDLHGRLLLVHGSGDDNVHPQHSWHFVDELVKAGKPFDLMIYPMRKHTIDDRPARRHLFNKMLEFWRLYL